MPKDEDIWTENQDKLLVDLVKNQKIDFQELYKYIPTKRTEAILRRAIKLGLKKRSKNLGYQKWTDNEDEILKNAIESGKSIQDTHSTYFDYRTKNSIRGRIEALGLKSSYHYFGNTYNQDFLKNQIY